MNVCISLLISSIIAFGGFNDFQVFLTSLFSLLIGLLSFPKICNDENSKDVANPVKDHNTVTRSRVISSNHIIK